jgi:hypothetical protein
MTPKEKGEELFDKFNYQICNDNGISENDSSEFCAKQCAIIAVDEILYALNVPPIKDEHSILWKAENEYWQQVKSAIQNKKPTQ